MEHTSAFQLNTIALLGSYVPRQCGIATFTKDLRDAIATQPGERRTLVVAMDDIPEGYPYPEEVKFQIRSHQLRDYHNAADMLNINQVDVAIVQHEYGIFGGGEGRYVLEFMDRLRMPIVTTLHTVLMEPSQGQAKVMLELAKRSERLVVMSERAVRILQEVYEIPAAKIRVIPHGIPDVPFVDPVFYKDQFGLEGRTVLLTFGLLSPGKGIETALRALPGIVKKRPDVIYVILGATHPHMLRKEGNAYRHSLERLAESLGVREHVMFHNRYVSLDELCRFIGAADVYLTPYLNKEQIVSGTLAYALGAGKAVVSSPFWYAEEMLDEGRGRLFPFADHGKLEAIVLELLEDEVERSAMRKRAYIHCRNMVWREVGAGYLALAREMLEERARRPRLAAPPPRARSSEPVPEADLSHVLTLTDDTGILQHAEYCAPDRRHGYCTDDNARALVMALMYYRLYQDRAALPLLRRYLSFLMHAFNPDVMRFRNFMSFDRRWLEEAGSDDAHGQAVWALGVAAAEGPDTSTVAVATRLFQQALGAVDSITSPRAWALMLVGIHAYLGRFDGDTQARRARGALAKRLYELFERNADEKWPWCEDTVTYGNAWLPHALILSGQWAPDEGMLAQGLRSLEWLVELQLDRNGAVSVIGNQGWLQRNGTRARFDQQPVELMALIQACAEAYRAEGDEKWLRRARAFLRWFLGNNDTHSIIYDYETGGCRDGLGPDGPNLNEGAESTLSWLISLLTIQHLFGVEAGVRKPPQAEASPKES